MINAPMIARSATASQTKPECSAAVALTRGKLTGAELTLTKLIRTIQTVVP